MFRGLHIGEARLLFALVAILFVGMVLNQAQQRSEQEEMNLAGEMPAISLSVAKDSPSSVSTLGVLELNSATLEELDLLPGIGPAKASAIVEERERRGGFADVDGLLEVSGIGEKTLQRLRPYVRVEGSPVAGMVQEQAVESASPVREPEAEKVYLNRAGSQELQRLNGVGPKLAERILEDRQKNGPYKTPQDFLRVKGVGPKILEKNLQLMVFD